MNLTQRFICVSVFASLLLCAIAIAPRPSSAGDDWLPIPPGDLALKDNPASPGAHAMILYRESAVNEKYTNTDGAYVNEYVRIKIFTQEGTDQANVEIPFFKESSDIADVRARTIRRDGTIVNFEGKAFEKIIENKYRRQYSALFLYDQSWTLSSDLFTREGRFLVPPYVSSYENFPLYFRQYGVSVKVTPERQTNGTYALTVHDIPGIADEPYMPPLRTLQARVEFYRLEQGTPADETQDRYWARIAKKWDDDLEHFINKKGLLEHG